MSRHRWIDIDEAALWFLVRPEELWCLIQDGLLSSRDRSRDDIVVRVDEVRRLADVFKPRSRY
jgi:hypothetical protein